MRRALVVLIASLVSSLTLASAALASSPTIVISEVYAAGGNAGAVYVNDYVELFNRGSTSVDVGSWSLQYATAAGNSWAVTPLAGTIAPGRHLLVQLGPTGTTGGPLPTPDVTGTTNLAASGGKVALVHDGAAILCGASPGSCAGTATIQDLVGYGSATDYEGAGAADALDATTAAVRAGGGCTDTDSNANDFTGGTPGPQNAAVTAAPCSGTPATGSAAQSVSVDADVASTISIALDHPTLSFGQVIAGTTPPPLAERITVFSTRSTGYELTVHRTAFAPADLPLGLTATAPAGAVANPVFAGGALAAIPLLTSSDLSVGSAARAAPATGDIWPASIGFTGPLPAVAPGHYTGTVTFTVIGR
jgi:hypothetical protein